MEEGDWDDLGPRLAVELGGEAARGPTNNDDEYRWAGVEDPKIVITTSHDPSAKLKQFAKVMLSYFHDQNIFGIVYAIKMRGIILLTLCQQMTHWRTDTLSILEICALFTDIISSYVFVINLKCI